MSEIEKLYENAGIKDKCGYICSAKGIGCNECPNKNRKFTAEKQIAILIALANYNLYEEDKRLLIDSFNGEIYIGFYRDIDLEANATDKEFSKCVARLINNLWQELTEEEKEQIRGILNANIQS